jgi:NAD(P)-dependent dehydrogenase (short-subunit alcohol dehydrogenase family)
MRTYVVTGAASGIGLATVKLIEANGGKAIGVDIKDCQVIADLSTLDGRQHAIERATALADGLVDAVIANAGSALSQSKTVSINFFGAIEFIEGMRPALMKSKSPRVVATSSMASLMPNDSQLVDFMMAGDEAKAIERAQALVDQGGGVEGLIYGSTKRALSRWIRRECIKSEWAGAGIPINAVGPGIVKTPMVAEMIATPEARESLAKVVPMPLNGYIEAENIADLIFWLAGEKNSNTTGQTIYIDGGSDAVIRGENIWD